MLFQFVVHSSVSFEEVILTPKSFKRCKYPKDSYIFCTPISVIFSWLVKVSNNFYKYTSDLITLPIDCMILSEVLHSGMIKLNSMIGVLLSNVLPKHSMPKWLMLGLLTPTLSEFNFFKWPKDQAKVIIPPLVMSIPLPKSNVRVRSSGINVVAPVSNSIP